MGHSFARHLSNWSAGNPFGLVNCQVRWFFKGGLSVQNAIRLFKSEVADFRPEAVVLLCGDNDINAETVAEELASLIHATASVFSGAQVRAKADSSFSGYTLQIHP